MRQSLLLIALGLVAIPLLLAHGDASAKTNSCETLFTVEGTVVSIHEDGGILLLTDAGEYVNVFGLGPPRYWVENGVSVPTAGDFISVDYYITPLKEGTTDFIYVAESVTTDDGTIQLRDAKCRPLWRSKPSKIKGNESKRR